MSICAATWTALRHRWCAAGLTACVLAVLGACAAPGQAPGPTLETPPPEATPAPAAGVGGHVLGRSARFVIYQPAAGETLRTVAARFLGSEAQAWVVADFNALPLPAAPALAQTPAPAEALRPLVVPLQPLNPTGVEADQYQTVPILCYHRFKAGNGNGHGASKMTISAGNFAQQLDWLARNDYRVITLAQLGNFLEGRQALPKRAVVITIDDGYESVYRVALPLLRKHGFAATLFVYTDFIGAGDALSWGQLQELVASNLIDVQAHSKSHRNLIERDAAEADERYRQRLDTETRTPRDLLQRRLGVRVQHFAFPYGDANQPLLDALLRQRYQLGLTVHPGGNAFFAQGLMLRRTMIYGDLDLAGFKQKLQVQQAFQPLPPPQRVTAPSPP